MTATDAVPYIGDVLAGAPRNWGRWGPSDEVGMLNELTSDEILSAVGSVSRGAVFTLQRVLGEPAGDPLWPGRTPAARTQTRDESHWDGPDAPQFPGGFHTADDRIEMALQGTTHADALGHVWFDGQLYNGYDARSSIGGLEHAGIVPIARRGIVGRCVLLDIARHRGVEALAAGDPITLEDLERCAGSQGVDIRPHDILLLRTNYLWWHEQDPGAFYASFNEPGLAYSADLVEWFAEREIAVLATDTMANELTKQSPQGGVMHLHNALMRNLGIVFIELCDLESLADDCARDGRYEGLFVAAPLKIARASGSPVNPVVIK